jgi:hypothetical protein
MDYYNKYLKYKTKYLKLKNQKGGNFINFEQFYNFIIPMCITYNNLFKNIVHIVGGSSVKYHMYINNIQEHIGITDDIDIYLIDNQDRTNDIDANIIEHFFRFILKYADTNNIKNLWSIKEENGLYKICYNNICYIDLTLYKPPSDEEKELEEEEDNTSLLQYAYTNLGFINKYQYIFSLNNLSVIEKTFSSIPFERLINQKGIDVYNNYITVKVPEWTEIVSDYRSNKHVDPNSPFKKVIERLEYQISPEYIAKLNRKVEKYTQKLAFLNRL